MKQLKIVVLVDEVEWGKATYIQFTGDSASKGFIRLEGFTVTTGLPISNNSVFLFKVYYKNTYMTDMELVPLQVQTQPASQTVLVNTPLGPECYFYNQEEINLLTQWDQGAESDWRKLKVKQKRLYLLGCLYWCGLPTRPIKSGHYILDGSQVKHKVDFYCLIGEVFFGNRGYFGQDLAGFNDCFSEIYILNKNSPLVEPGARVTILNKAQLEKVLNRKVKDYFSVFIEDLKAHSFTVEVS